MSNFKPFKLIKDYSKQHPWRFYSILCVVSATAYGELKFRSMRRKELLVDKENEPVAKNEYEQYLISQKKIKENQMSLDEERNKLKQIIDGANDNTNYNKYNNDDNIDNNNNGNNNDDNNNDDNSNSNDNIKEKKETLFNSTKEKLNQLKTNVKAKKENIENKETVKNVKKDLSDSIKKLKGSTKKLSSKISKENITEKIKLNKKKSNSNVTISTDNIEEVSEDDSKKTNNISFFHNNNERFKDYFQKITRKNNDSFYRQYDRAQSSNKENENYNNNEEEEIYDNNQPERMIFLYDVNSQELNKN